MVLADIATKARALTKTDTTSYPDANLLIDINIWYPKVVTMILDSMDEQDYDDPRRTDYPVITTPMVSNQRDYSFPVSLEVLKIKRVDVSYDGTHYFQSLPIDNGEMEFGLGSDSDTDGNFTRLQPRHDIKYNSLFLYPMPGTSDSSGIIRIEFARDVTLFTAGDLTTGTAVPGFDEPFHAMLAYGPAVDYATSNMLPNQQALTQMQTDLEARLRSHYGRKEVDRFIAMTADPVNAYT